MSGLFLLAALLSAPSQPHTVFGIGVDSCASALQPQRRLEKSVWIIGYWSGFNASIDARVGHTTDTQGVIGEVDLYCQAHPSENFSDAVGLVYAQM